MRVETKPVALVMRRTMSFVASHSWLVVTPIALLDDVCRHAASYVTVCATPDKPAIVTVVCPTP